MSLPLTPDMFRIILEALPAGLLVVDPERRIVLWNEGAEKIAGFLRQEVIGRPCQQDLLMHCDGENRCLCAGDCPVLGAMHDGQPREGTLLLRHKAGQRIPVRARTVPLRDERGLIVGAAQVFDELHRSAAFGHHECGMAAIAETVAAVFDAAAGEAKDATVALLAIRLNGLEQLAASRGKNAAVALVQAVSQSLCHNLHPEDRLGWCTEGRFIAVLPDCSARIAERVAGRLRKVASATSVPWWGDRLSGEATVEVSNAQPGDTAASLLARAAAALHRVE